MEDAGGPVGCWYLLAISKGVVDANRAKHPVGRYFERRPSPALPSQELLGSLVARCAEWMVKSSGESPQGSRVSAVGKAETTARRTATTRNDDVGGGGGDTLVSVQLRVIGLLL